MLRAIVFDKDGTLFDFHETWGGWAATALDTLAGGDRALVAQLSDAIGYDLVLGHFRPDSPAIAGTSASAAAKHRDHLIIPRIRRFLWVISRKLPEMDLTMVVRTRITRRGLACERRRC